jgi:hypothetical protein
MTSPLHPRQSCSAYSHWRGPIDQPRWHIEVRFDNETVPTHQEYVEGPGLPLLDKLQHTIADLIYQMPDEPHTLQIEMTEVPF